MIAIDALGEQPIELLALRTHGIPKPSPFHVQIFNPAQGSIRIPSKVFGTAITSHVTKCDELFAARILRGLGRCAWDQIRVPRDEN
jgi:hypothetical protein